MLNKEHITRGESKVFYGFVLVNGKKVINTFVSGTTKDEDEANAAFIAEAFNVLSETDKTPRELLDENAQLKKALTDIVEAFDKYDSTDFYILDAKQLLNK